MSVWNPSSGSPEVYPGRRPDPPGSALLSTGTWPSLAESLRLSPRELQVVKGVFQDHKEESIAADLGISPHTVSTYLQRIYAKLCVGSRPQLIVRVVAEYLRAAGADAARVRDR
jgi:DNA-binding NarL/FixJ family response regulator